MTHRTGRRQNNYNKIWTGAAVRYLERLAQRNTPTGLIADALGRTEDSIRSKASEENISLKPTNKSPYNRRKG